MNCRHCNSPLTHKFIDLGFAPPSNAYLKEADLNKPEIYFPLKIYVCDKCWLIQTADYADADELFRYDYAYFSSTSSTWLKHAKSYSDMIIRRLGIDKNSFVVEVASNDGYLLKNFIEKKIPCLGIEPTESTASMAEGQGIPVIKKFFGSNLADKLVSEGKLSDLIIGNNVYAHIPDINDFTMGLKKLLKPNGTITLEFQYIRRLIQFSQFDTIYHEHFSYHSLTSVKNIFHNYGLRIYDVEEVTTHGGSLRIYGCHSEDSREESSSVTKVLKEEETDGLHDLNTYRSFQRKADKIKDDLLTFLIDQKRKRKTVAAYGAAAKGNTLLNYAGIKPDLVHYVCDASPSKQGKYMPGSHIPILSPDALQLYKPDLVLIFPWNIAEEVMDQQSIVRTWSGRFVTAIPKLELK